MTNGRARAPARDESCVCAPDGAGTNAELNNGGRSREDGAKNEEKGEESKSRKRDSADFPRVLGIVDRRRSEEARRAQSKKNIYGFLFFGSSSITRLILSPLGSDFPVFHG